MGERAAGAAGVDRRRGVDAEVGQRALRAGDVVEAAEHVVGERDRVDAEVEQGPAGQLGLREPGRAVGPEQLAVVGVDEHDLAQRARPRPCAGRRRSAAGSGSTSPRRRAGLRTAAVASTSSASRRLRVNAFSTSTGLPARSASRACSWCSLCGLATYTASTSGSATRSAYDPWARSTPWRLANSCARSSEREPTATTRERVPSCTASAKMLAMPPGASTPQRIGRGRPSGRERWGRRAAVGAMRAAYGAA